MIAPDAAAAWNPHARNLTNVLVQATCGGARRVPGQTNFRAHGTKERPTSVPPQHAHDINVSCAAGRRLRRWGTNLIAVDGPRAETAVARHDDAVLDGDGPAHLLDSVGARARWLLGEGSARLSVDHRQPAAVVEPDEGVSAPAVAGRRDGRLVVLVA